MAMAHEALKAMGDKGHEWMARDFSWDSVARDMLGVYLWLARGASRRPWSGSANYPAMPPCHRTPASLRIITSTPTVIVGEKAIAAGLVSV
jgi:hypothetical protein